MNRVRSRYQGYTIVETMIFLAVSAALFISVMLLVGGQQNKAQFTQSIRDIDSRMQDVISNIATGVYNNTNNFVCTGIQPSGQPAIVGVVAANNQGTNKDCIFVGRVMQFTNGSDYNTFTMVGSRLTPAPAKQEVQTLYQAHPIPIDAGITSNLGFPSATDSNTLSNGLSVTSMYYTDISGRHNIGAVGFFSSFASSNGIGIASGSTTTDLLPIAYPASDITKSRQAMVDDIINYLNPSSPSSPDPPEKNPSGGVTICFKSGGTDQFGVMTIGSNGRQLTTKVEILDTATATVGAGARCS